MWVELNVPVPGNLAPLCGYPGEARYVGLCWQPCGDECEYDDGQVSGTGAWWPYLAYTQHCGVAHALTGFDLGSSDGEAKHILVIDQAERKAFVADVRTGREFLRRQLHPPLPEPEAHDVAENLADLLDVTKWTEQPIDMAEVEARMRAEAEATQAMLHFLDTFLPREE